jgi:biotin synthase-related radical SAM superfamily protein
LERSGVDLKRSDDRVEVDFEPSKDRVIIDLEPSNDSVDRVIDDFEKSAASFVHSNMKVPAVEVFAKLGETEAGVVRAVVIVIEDEVLMDVIALKEEDALKDVATEYISKTTSL